MWDKDSDVYVWASTTDSLPHRTFIHVWPCKEDTGHEEEKDTQHEKIPDAIARLRELQAEGYKVPDHCFERLEREQKQLDEKKKLEQDRRKGRKSAFR
jgi:hypothetical protein